MVNKAANKRDRRPRVTSRYGSLAVGYPPPLKPKSTTTKSKSQSQYQNQVQKIQDACALAAR